MPAQLRGATVQTMMRKRDHLFTLFVTFSRGLSGTWFANPFFQFARDECFDAECFLGGRDLVFWMRTRTVRRRLSCNGCGFEL
jgi:hypothetical protein